MLKYTGHEDAQVLDDRLQTPVLCTVAPVYPLTPDLSEPSTPCQNIPVDKFNDRNTCTRAVLELA